MDYFTGGLCMRRDVIVIILSMLLLVPMIPYISAANVPSASVSITSEGTTLIQGPKDEAVLIHTIQSTGMIDVFSSDTTVMNGLSIMAMWYRDRNVPVWPFAYLFGHAPDYESVYPGAWMFFLYSVSSGTIDLDAKINAIQSIAESRFGFRFEVMQKASAYAIGYITLRAPAGVNLTNFINSIECPDNTVYSKFNTTILKNATYKQISFIYTPGSSSFYSMYNIHSKPVENSGNYTLDISPIFETKEFKLNSSYYFNIFVPYANITDHHGIGSLNPWPFALIYIDKNTGDILNLTVEDITYNFDLKAPSLLVYTTLDNYQIPNSGTAHLLVHVKNIGNSPAYNLQLVQMRPTEFGGTVYQNNSVNYLAPGDSFDYVIEITAGASVDSLVNFDPAYLLYSTKQSSGETLISIGQSLVAAVGTVNKPVMNIYVTTPKGNIKQGEDILFTFHITNNGTAPGSAILDFTSAVEWFGAVDTPGSFAYNASLGAGETATYNISVKATVPFVWAWSAIGDVPAFFEIRIPEVTTFTLNGFPIFVNIDPEFGYGLPEFEIQRIVSGDTITVKVTNVGNGAAYALYVYDLIPQGATVVGGNYTGIFTDTNSQHKFVYSHVTILRPGESFSFTYTLSTSSYLLSSNLIPADDEVAVSKTKYMFRDLPIEEYQSPETTTGSSSTSTGTNGTSGTSSETNSTAGSGLPEIPLNSETLTYIGIGIAVLAIILVIKKRH